MKNLEEYFFGLKDSSILKIRKYDTKITDAIRNNLCYRVDDMTVKPHRFYLYEKNNQNQKPANAK
jgi:hypothetical protein